VNLARSLVLVLAAAGPAGQAELPEYVLKAGFLFNFAKYVEWPDTAFNGPDDPLVIAVVGKDPFGDDLDRSLRGKTVKGRTIRIARYGSVSEIRNAHILFVPRTEAGKTDEIVQKLRTRPVLLVGEAPAFCREGGAINILVREGQPRLEANPEAAARARLTIDAKLLRAATVVREDP